MRKLAIFTGGEKVVELNTLQKEVNEFAEKQNVSIESCELSSVTKMEKQGDNEVMVSIPVAVVIYKNN